MSIEVELPDGTVIYDVPEGTTKTQIQRMYAGRYGVPKQVVEDAPMDVDPAAGLSPLQKITIGAGAAADRTYRGIRSLLPPGLIPQDLSGGEGESDAALYEKRHPGPWATGGEIATDLSLSAIPVAKVANLPKALRMGGRIAPAAADVTANAGYSAITNPEDRGSAAALGGAGAATGRVLSKALGRPVSPSATAQKLLDRGVDLTPAQAGAGMGGALARHAERVASPLPIVGPKLKAVQQQAVKTWNEKLVEHATEAGDDAMLDVIRSVQSKAPVIKRDGLFYPHELAIAAHRMDNPELVSHAKEMSEVFTGPTGKLGEFLDLGKSAAGLATMTAIHPGGALSTLPPAVMALLSTFPQGRQVLLGQYPLQKLMAERPDIASQVLRAIAQQQLEPARAEP